MLIKLSFFYVMSEATLCRLHHHNITSHSMIQLDENNLNSSLSHHTSLCVLNGYIAWIELNSKYWLWCGCSMVSKSNFGCLTFSVSVVVWKKCIHITLLTFLKYLFNDITEMLLCLLMLDLFAGWNKGGIHFTINRWFWLELGTFFFIFFTDPV